MHDPDIVIAPADHPSLGDGVADFVAGLRSEQRYFGPSARCNPKPFPSLIEELERPDGIRLAAVGADRVVGAVRVDDVGEAFVAVAMGRRGRGIGTSLLTAAVAHVPAGRQRIMLRAGRRGSAIQRTAERLGAVAVDVGGGRVELSLPVIDHRVPTSA